LNQQTSAQQAAARQAQQQAYLAQVIEPPDAEEEGQESPASNDPQGSNELSTFENSEMLIADPLYAD